jgi:hypothetical protein
MKLVLRRLRFDWRPGLPKRPSVPSLAFAFRERKPWRGAARGTGTAPGRFPNLRLTKP